MENSEVIKLVLAYLVSSGLIAKLFNWLGGRLTPSKFKGYLKYMPQIIKIIECIALMPNMTDAERRAKGIQQIQMLLGCNESTSRYLLETALALFKERKK